MIGKTNVVINNNLGTIVWNGSLDFDLFYGYNDNDTLTWHSDTLLTDSSLIDTETFIIKTGYESSPLVCLPTIDTPLTGYTAWEYTVEKAAEIVEGLIVKYYVLIDSNNNLSLYAKMNAIKAVWGSTFTALYKK